MAATFVSRRCVGCRECRTLSSAGLCWCCSRKPSVRASHVPQRQLRQGITIPLSAAELAEVLMTPRREARDLLRRGPLTEPELARRLMYPVETIREALAGWGWFRRVGDRYELIEEAVPV